MKNGTLFSSTKRSNICKRLLLFFFAKNMYKYISKSISKNVSSKFSQKCIDHAKHFTINEVKATSKRSIQKTAVATNDSIRNKIVDEITRISKTSQKNNPEANEEDVLRERYTSSDQRQKIIDDLRLI